MKLSRVFVPLALGAVTTFVTAWGLLIGEARTGSIHSRMPLGSANTAEYLHVVEEFSGHTQWIAFMTSRPDGGESYGSVLCNAPPCTLQPTLVGDIQSRLEVFRDRPRWPATLPVTFNGDLIGYSVRSSGWPWPALRTLGYATSSSEGWRLGPNIRYRPVRHPRFTLDPGDGTLPLEPTWGFAADAALFGGAWWCLLFGVRDTRAWLRRRRGLCDVCGYPRLSLSDASPCPECGALSAHAKAERAA